MLQRQRPLAALRREAGGVSTGASQLGALLALGVAGPRVLATSLGQGDAGADHAQQQGQTGRRRPADEGAVAAGELAEAIPGPGWASEDRLVVEETLQVASQFRSRGVAASRLLGHRLEADR